MIIISTLASTKMVNVFALMIVFLRFEWLIKDKPLLLSFCLTSYFYFLSKVCRQYTFNSIYITWSSKPIIYPHQLVINWCARVGTYNFSRKVLKPKILSLKENSFYIVHCLCNIMTYLILMWFYFLSTCLVIHIFNNLLFLCAVVAYIGKSSNVLFFINNYFRDLPFVVLLLLRPGDVETNLGPKKASVIKCYHWNLNGLAVHDFLKVSLIEAFITIHNSLIICLSEMLQDSTAP